MATISHGLLIPLHLRRSSAFKDDVAFLHALDETVLSEAAGIARHIAAGGSSDTEVVERLSESAGLKLEDCSSAVSALALLQSRAVEYELGEDQIGVALADFLERSTTEVATLAGFIAVQGEDRDRILASEAFSTPPFLCSTEFRPALRQMGSRLVPGLEWTIAYHDSHGKHESFSFGLSGAQARSLLTDIREAIEELSRLQPTDVPGSGEG